VWTNTAAERGGTHGIVAEIAARRAGVWQPGHMGERSVTACETDTRDRRPIDAFTRRKAWLCAATPDSPYLHATALVPIVLRQGTATEFGQARAVCMQRGGRDVTGPGTQRYRGQHAFSTAAEYLTFVRDYCASQAWPKELICLTLGADPLPFEENGTEQLYRLACDHEGRVEGCVGYAKLMETRGEPQHAGRYRERASLLRSRRR
jgi:hypothetical protein